jgi:hypothetical protein
MRPPPHVLFPLGDYGGNQRLVKTAAENVTIEVEVGKRRCPKCNTITFHLVCTCGAHTEVLEGKLERQMINLSEELERAQKNVKEHILPETIKGVIGTISKHKTPEPLEKGILRAKHNVYVFKDGTIRFDMTDAPLTHFKPKEIGVPLKRVRELGYTKHEPAHLLRIMQKRGLPTTLGGMNATADLLIDDIHHALEIMKKRDRYSVLKDIDDKDLMKVITELYEVP